MACLHIFSNYWKPETENLRGRWQERSCYLQISQHTTLQISRHQLCGPTQKRNQQKLGWSLPGDPPDGKRVCPSDKGSVEKLKVLETDQCFYCNCFEEYLTSQDMCLLQRPDYMQAAPQGQREGDPSAAQGALIFFDWDLHKTGPSPACWGQVPHGSL